MVDKNKGDSTKKELTRTKSQDSEEENQTAQSEIVNIICDFQKERVEAYKNVQGQHLPQDTFNAEEVNEFGYEKRQTQQEDLKTAQDEACAAIEQSLSQVTHESKDTETKASEMKAYIKSREIIDDEDEVFRLQEADHNNPTPDLD